MWAQRKTGMGTQLFNIRLDLDFIEPAALEISH